ncbi:MAG: hypothetical protein CFE21_10335 [Bacteroidetes bacterium B1(2017)]|nr:MAG: hypothetical protein CFE21_10335 [Bacteroidetes bacterium B1(2017)]
MRKNTLLLIMLMGFVGIVNAQTEVKNFQVHFKSDEYTLDQDDRNVLYQLMKQMQTNTYCEVVLKAHTDQDASATYNEELSAKRAKSVNDYLLENGISQQRISTYAFGESKPIKSNSNEFGKAQNRRVEIAVNYYSYSTVNDFLKLIGGNYKQSFTLKPDADNTIVAKNGLRVVLPKGSLETIDGKPLGKGELSMEIEEFFTANDAATQQLSTVADGKILESGGMFSVKVKQNGQELRLKDGKPMQVDLPSKNLQNNMQVFVPVLNSQGITEWKTTAQPFDLKPKKEIKLPHTKINVAQLRKAKEEVDVREIRGLEYYYKPLPIPKRPLPPKKHHEIAMASKHELFPWYERMFYPRFYVEKKVAEENATRIKLNQKNNARYASKFAAYELALDKYKVDSANFETSELASFRDWLNQSEVKFKEAKLILEKASFNKGVERFCELSEQEKLTSLNPKGMFISMTRPSVSQQFLYGTVMATLDRITELKDKSLLMAIGLYANKQSQIFIGVKEQERKWLYSNYVRNDFTADKLKNNSEFAGIFDNAQLDILKQREKLGMLEENTIVENIYSASLSNFGVYNCDRFSNTPPTQMAEIEIPYKGNARVSFFVPDMNSFIYAYHDAKDKYHLKLPIGKQVKMVVLGFNEKGEPVFQNTALTITGNQTIEPNVKVSTIFDIRNSLSRM